MSSLCAGRSVRASLEKRRVLAAPDSDDPECELRIERLLLFARLIGHVYLIHHHHTRHCDAEG
jgi:hypothetical protein